MWIQVREISGTHTFQVDNLSKLTKIEDLRSRLVQVFNVKEEDQRLFYRGKQMEDGHTLYDYDVGLNDLIQILIKRMLPQPIPLTDKPVADTTNDGSTSDKENAEPINIGHALPSIEQEYSGQNIYKIGDVIDARDTTIGAWFEAKIVNVVHGITDTKSLDHTTILSLNIGKSDGFTYDICFEKYPYEICKVLSTEIRPRARTLIRLADVEVKQHIMANYNCEQPDTRGFWYDCIVTGKKDTQKVKELVATVFIGPDLTPLDNCHLIFIRELFGIEVVGSQLSQADPSVANIKTRQNKPECDHCHDNPKKKCKSCACVVCGDKKHPDQTILCDECNDAYHLYCLKPALSSVPQDDDWYCPQCKNDETAIVRIGEKLKTNKKKAKMASAKNTSGRDWGKGMACVGRSKMCTIVSSNHYGPIPGVEVGTMWKFRVQVSEAGVHRPHVAGIHGREDDGAYSIVLSGGYEDDADNGEEFFYTGSGGRDLSGNKRTAEQSCDQTLTRMNKALAKNCNSPLNNIKGAQATDWQTGKPVRVVRNCKGSKHSQYAPEEGNRYDGIYKVVKYWPEKGKSSFLVWRYLLRRDDPIPAPWTKAGQKRIKNLGLKMQYPDGYLESLQLKEKDANKKDDDNTTRGNINRKRKSEALAHISKRKRDIPELEIQVAKYSLEAATMKLITTDLLNQKLWDEALSFVSRGSKIFHEKVEELFLCICCQEIVCKPITLNCAHNLCQMCLMRSFQADVYSCPACRADLDKNMSVTINTTLTEILNNLFPGYQIGR